MVTIRHHGFFRLPWIPAFAENRICSEVAVSETFHYVRQAAGSTLRLDTLKRFNWSSGFFHTLIRGMTLRSIHIQSRAEFIGQ